VREIAAVLDCHVADVVGLRDLVPLLMLGQLRRPPHVDAGRFGAADAVASSSADQLTLAFPHPDSAAPRPVKAQAFGGCDVRPLHAADAERLTPEVSNCVLKTVTSPASPSAALINMSATPRTGRGRALEPRPADTRHRLVPHYRNPSSIDPNIGRPSGDQAWVECQKSGFTASSNSPVH
jgi:hypothetical protein